MSVKDDLLFREWLDIKYDHNPSPAASALEQYVLNDSKEGSTYILPLAKLNSPNDPGHLLLRHDGEQLLYKLTFMPQNSHYGNPKQTKWHAWDPHWDNPDPNDIAKVTLRRNIINSTLNDILTAAAENKTISKSFLTDNALDLLQSATVNYEVNYLNTPGSEKTITESWLKALEVLANDSITLDMESFQIKDTKDQSHQVLHFLTQDKQSKFMTFDSSDDVNHFLQIRGIDRNTLKETSSLTQNPKRDTPPPDKDTAQTGMESNQTSFRFSYLETPENSPTSMEAKPNSLPSGNISDYLADKFGPMVAETLPVSSFPQQQDIVYITKFPNEYNGYRLTVESQGCDNEADIYNSTGRTFHITMTPEAVRALKDNNYLVGDRIHLQWINPPNSQGNLSYTENKVSIESLAASQDLLARQGPHPPNTKITPDMYSDFREAGTLHGFIMAGARNCNLKPQTFANNFFSGAYDETNLVFDPNYRNYPDAFETVEAYHKGAYLYCDVDLPPRSRFTVNRYQLTGMPQDLSDEGGTIHLTSVDNKETISLFLDKKQAELFLAAKPQPYDRIDCVTTVNNDKKDILNPHNFPLIRVHPTNPQGEPEKPLTILNSAWSAKQAELVKPKSHSIGPRM